MPEYRRNRVPGGTYFFTINLLDRQSSLLVERIEALRAAVTFVRRKYRFHVDAWVVLPEHMHAVWTLPAGDDDFSGRWREIKKAFVRAIPGGERVALAPAARGERGIWQRRFWEHTVRDDADYASHVDYTHFNPVKHGLVSDAALWPFSSFHRCVRSGIYPAGWAAGDVDWGAMGERR